VWSDRAQLYRKSEAHRSGADLDLIVEWSAEARTALDVATGGGHVARRLREAGLEVVTCDQAPGMEPDVICAAEDLSFADGSFDLVACRVAAHHFSDVAAAVAEMARVSGDRVLVADNLFVSEDGEEADRLRDPTHVRNYTEGEWRSFFDAAGLRVQSAVRCDQTVELEPWLERTGCVGDEAQRVRALLSDQIADGRLTVPRVALKGALASHSGARPRMARKSDQDA
jgi:SAM-dependent methyltransferase